MHPQENTPPAYYARPTGPTSPPQLSRWWEPKKEASFRGAPHIAGSLLLAGYTLVIASLTATTTATMYVPLVMIAIFVCNIATQQWSTRMWNTRWRFQPYRKPWLERILFIGETILLAALLTCAFLHQTTTVTVFSIVTVIYILTTSIPIYRKHPGLIPHVTTPHGLIDGE